MSGRRPRRYRITLEVKGGGKKRIGEAPEHDLEGWVSRYYEGRGRKSPDFFEGAEPSTGYSMIMMVLNDGDNRGIPIPFEDYPAAVKVAVQRLHEGMVARVTDIDADIDADIDEDFDDDFDEDLDLPSRADGRSTNGSWWRRSRRRGRTRYRITLGVRGGGKRIGEAPEPALLNWVGWHYEDRGRKSPAFYDAEEPSGGDSMVMVVFNDGRGGDRGIPFAVENYPAAAKAAVQRLHKGKVVRVIDLDINEDIDHSAPFDINKFIDNL